MLRHSTDKPLLAWLQSSIRDTLQLYIVIIVTNNSASSGSSTFRGVLSALCSVLWLSVWRVGE